MTATDAPMSQPRPWGGSPSEEFAAFCENEFERRLNSGKKFDEGAYRKAMALVLDRLTQLEEEGRP